MTWLMIAIGALFGATMRFGTDRFLIARFGTEWPYGTFTVNMFGSLVLGLITGYAVRVAAVDADGWSYFSALAGIGFCGTLTTFSAFSAQVLTMSQERTHWRGPAYALVSVIIGFALATLGYVITA